MKEGTIILLDGTSSSGKSSLADALQEIFDEPYLDAGIDKFIWMLPRRYLERPLWDEVLGLANRAGPQGHKLFSGMRHSIAALCRAGNNVLADHVLVDPRWLYECAELFLSLRAYFIGVRCPLDAVVQRESERKNRTPGQARAQFPLVHAHALYDLEVDTSLDSIGECARQIKRRVEGGLPPTALRTLHERFTSARKSPNGNSRLAESRST